MRKRRLPLQDPAQNLRPLWRGGGGGGVLAGTRRQSAAGDGVPPSLQIPPHTCLHLMRVVLPGPILHANLTNWH